MRKNGFWLNAFLVCVGVVIGSMAAELTSGVPFLSWLSYGLSFGTEAPFVLDLNVVRLTFGINLHLTVSSVIFIALSLFLGRLIAKK
ncbi:MAG: DUF4321 domain-containing protein [Ruminococcaceae bacterium]|nr:DUF4321 domain-containing protein [Oscillospiraceae bacterium]